MIKDHTKHLVYQCPEKTTKIQSHGVLVYNPFVGNLDIPTTKSKQLQEQETQVPLF